MLKKRSRQFVEIMGVQVTRFAANVGIGRSTLYMWWNDQIVISDTLMQKIEDYLTKYGF